MGERCFLNVSSEGSLVLESQAKGESGEEVLSVQIPVFDLLSESSLFDQRSVNVLCFLDMRVNWGREEVAKNFREA